MSNSSDKLRTLKKMDFKEGELLETLQVLLNIEDTSFGIRDDYINLYYCGNSLLKIEYDDNKKALTVKFNAGHFCCYEGHKGVYPRKESEFEGWDDEWKKIKKALERDLGNNIVKLNKTIDKYLEEKKAKEKPEWYFNDVLHNREEAETFKKEVCPILKKAVKYYVDRNDSKNSAKERKYAQELFAQNDWEQFSRGSSPCLFFSDSDYRLPDNKYDTIDKSILNDLNEWPDKIFNDAKKIALPGAPDGVGAFRKRSGKIVPCFIEVKYGTGSYSGSSGIRKHLRDMVILTKNTIEDRKKEIEFSYSYRSKQPNAHIEWSNEKPMILFILNHSDTDEAKKKLIRIIKKLVKDVKGIDEAVSEYSDNIIFIFTKEEDGKDLISCYLDETKHFSLKSLFDKKGIATI